MSEATIQGSDTIDLSRFDPNDPSMVNRLYREYLTAMFVWVKNGLLFDSNNPTLHTACDRVSRVANTIRTHFDNTADLDFLTDGVYVNQRLLKLQGSRFDQAEYLGAIWGSVGIGSIGPTDQTEREDWLRLIDELRKFATGQTEIETMREVKVEKFRMRQLVGVGKKGTKESAITDRMRALRAYSIAVITMREVIERVTGGGRLRLSDIKRPLLDLITVSEDCQDILVALVNLKRNKTEPFHHFINTAVLVILMARELKIDRENFLELASSAVLHDLGRATLPNTRANLDELDGIWAQESIFQIAVASASFTQTARRIAAANEVRLAIDPQHPARVAYPLDLSASSQLIAVAHAYDLLTTPRVERPALLPDEALRVLRAEAGRRYDATAVRVLLNVLGVFPIGSVVSLSNGQTAIVIETQKGGDGTRPRIKLVRDANGSPVGGALVDLAQTPGLDIVGCRDAEEEQVNMPAFLLS